MTSVSLSRDLMLHMRGEPSPLEIGASQSAAWRSADLFSRFLIPPSQLRTRSLACNRVASRLASLPTHPTRADPREGCQGKPRKKSPPMELTPRCSLG